MHLLPTNFHADTEFPFQAWSHPITLMAQTLIGIIIFNTSAFSCIYRTQNLIPLTPFHWQKLFNMFNKVFLCFKNKLEEGGFCSAFLQKQFVSGTLCLFLPELLFLWGFRKACPSCGWVPFPGEVQEKLYQMIFLNLLWRCWLLTLISSSLLSTGSAINNQTQRNMWERI